MRTAARLGLYGVGLAVAFGGAFAAAGAAVPQSTVERWTDEARGHTMDDSDRARPGTTAPAHGATGEGHADHEAAATGHDGVRGVALAEAGYVFGPVRAPATTGEAGTLAFEVRGPDGEPVTDFTGSHGKDLHLVVVRTDGSAFRHVHPTMDADGTWSLPWRWDAAGTYRVYADFVPGTDGPLTLTRTVEVAGEVRPVPAVPTAATSVDGYDVRLSGDLVAGTASELELTVSRGGEPVEELQPYLGAFGHLVALREGDLAYLHVHPEGAEPAAGDLSGPTIRFVAQAPTAGRYLLYLDFRVGGTVRTAPLVVDAAGPGADPPSGEPGPHAGADDHDH